MAPCQRAPPSALLERLAPLQDHAGSTLGSQNNYSPSTEACWEMESWVCSVVDKSTTESDRMNLKKHHVSNNPRQTAGPGSAEDHTYWSPAWTQTLLKLVLRGFRILFKFSKNKQIKQEVLIQRCVPRGRKHAESSCIMCFCSV